MRVVVGLAGVAMLWAPASAWWRQHTRERCAEAYDASIEAWRDASAAGSTCAANALLVDSWREPVDSPREAIRRADRYRGACAGSAEVGMLAHAIEASTRAREACRE